MNPWKTILTEPRQTIRKIVSVNPDRGIWLLAWTYGFLSILNAFQSMTFGNIAHLAILLPIAIILAPLWGMVVFGVWSWVVQKIGLLFKGKGNFKTVRAALAWSCVPLSVNIALWILLILLLGAPLFQTAKPGAGPSAILMLILLAKVGIVVWSLVIYINTLAEVQQFSIARSIISIVLAWIAIGIVVVVICLVLGLLTSITLYPAALYYLTLRMDL